MTEMKNPPTFVEGILICIARARLALLAGAVASVYRVLPREKKDAILFFHPFP